MNSIAFQKLSHGSLVQIPCNSQKERVERQLQQNQTINKL